MELVPPFTYFVIGFNTLSPTKISKINVIPLRTKIHEVENFGERTEPEKEEKSRETFLRLERVSTKHTLLSLGKKK